MNQDKFIFLQGDCIEVMRAMPENSIDSIVTDPPYELGFMGKSWDASGIAYNVDMWREAMRVLKPGGHMLAFSGSRTYHRMTCAIEDAGFEIRDQIMWVYGSGFPKSLNVGKAIERVCVEDLPDTVEDHQDRDELIDQWSGWGTALKPAHEPICVARKPLIGTVVANVLQHGTGAINIDGCRVGTDDTRQASYRMTSKGIEGGGFGSGQMHASERDVMAGSASGRWPANLIHDGSDEVVALFPAKAGAVAPVLGTEPSSMTKSVFGQINRQASNSFHDDMGSAARFFYCAKASRADRNEGLGEVPPQFKHGSTLRDAENLTARVGNHHPTVKPTDLMAYLCRLVTPPNGTVLDPFMGSGSTGKAAVREGFRFIGIEREAEYMAVAQARIKHEYEMMLNTESVDSSSQLDLFNVVAA